MRKIEQELINAIRSGIEWKSGNTAFIGGLVMLHGHVIAKCDNGVWCINLQGYNTVTTRSHLTAILAEFSNSALGVSTCKGQPCIVYRSGTYGDISVDEWHHIL